VKQVGTALVQCRCKNVLEIRQVERLHEVVPEAGLAGSGAIAIVPPAGLGGHEAAGRRAHRNNRKGMMTLPLIGAPARVLRSHHFLLGGDGAFPGFLASGIALMRCRHATEG